MIVTIDRLKQAHVDVDSPVQVALPPTTIQRRTIRCTAIQCKASTTFQILLPYQEAQLLHLGSGGSYVANNYCEPLQRTLLTDQTSFSGFRDTLYQCCLDFNSQLWVFVALCYFVLALTTGRNPVPMSPPLLMCVVVSNCSDWSGLM